MLITLLLLLLIHLVLLSVLVVLLLVSSFVLCLEFAFLLNPIDEVKQREDEVPSDLLLDLVVVDAEFPLNELDALEDNPDFVDALAILGRKQLILLEQLLALLNFNLMD